MSMIKQVLSELDSSEEPASSERLDHQYCSSYYIEEKENSPKKRIIISIIIATIVTSTIITFALIKNKSHHMTQSNSTNTAIHQEPTTYPKEVTVIARKPPSKIHASQKHGKHYAPRDIDTTKRDHKSIRKNTLYSNLTKVIPAPRSSPTIDRIAVKKSIHRQQRSAGKLAQVSTATKKKTQKKPISIKRKLSLANQKLKATPLAVANSTPLPAAGSSTAIKSKNTQATKENKLASNTIELESNKKAYFIFNKIVNSIKQNSSAYTINNIINQTLSTRLDENQLLQIARLLLSKNKIDSANRFLSQVTPTYPLSLPIIKLHAKTLYLKGRYMQALALLSKTTPSFYEHPKYYSLMASIYVKLNQPILANQIYERLIKNQPNQFQYWLGLAITYQQLNNTDQAITSYQHTLSLIPLDSDVAKFARQQLYQLQRNS